jgi:hypothetical protein
MSVYVANLISQSASYLLDILPPMQYEVDTWRSPSENKLKEIKRSRDIIWRENRITD